MIQVQLWVKDATYTVFVYPSQVVLPPQTTNLLSGSWMAAANLTATGRSPEASMKDTSHCDDVSLELAQSKPLHRAGR